MSDTLRVTPEALHAGAQRLGDIYEAIDAALSKVHEGHQSVQGRWNGSSADKADTMWTDLHSAFRGHLNSLATNVEDMHTAARAYTDQDEASRTGLDEQM